MLQGDELVGNGFELYVADEIQVVSDGHLTVQESNKLSWIVLLGQDIIPEENLFFFNALIHIDILNI